MSFVASNLDAKAAIARANGYSTYPSGQCLGFVDKVFAKPASDHQVNGGPAYSTAKIAADYVPANRRYDRSHARAGMVAFYSNGLAAGHTTVLVDPSDARSTDKLTGGHVATVSIDSIVASWGGRPFRFATDWLMGHNIVNLGAAAGGAAPASVPANATVASIQTALNRFGYHLTVDGIRGPLTIAAVRAFQASHGLVVDAIVGPKTWAALNTVQVATKATIRQGSVSADVTYLQTRLRAHGYSVTVDGRFGPATRNAVIAFQRACKIGVDGVVGAQTWSKLG